MHDQDAKPANLGSNDDGYYFFIYLLEAVPKIENTREVFGDYIDIYDIQRAEDDGATVPIY